MKRLWICLIVILSMLSISCTHRLIDFTMISSKNVELSKMAQYARSPGRVSGQDESVIIFVFPVKIAHPKMAVDRAIESMPGCVALVDGVLTSTTVMLPPLFGVVTYEVEGTCLVDREISNRILFKSPSSRQ